MLQIQSTPAIQMSLHLDFDRAESRKFFFRGSMTRSTTNFDSTRSSQFAKVFSHGILLTILPARSSQSCGKAQCIGENPLESQKVRSVFEILMTKHFYEIFTSKSYAVSVSLAKPATYLWLSVRNLLQNICFL